MVKQWQKLKLTEIKTGRALDVLVRPASTGGNFMKLWQRVGTGRRIEKLKGASLKVLWHLAMVAGWNNIIPGTSETARSMKLKQPNVARAYRELIEADFIVRREGVYYLSPMFCWKGNEEQYEQAVKTLSLKRSDSLTANMIGEGEQVLH